MADNAPLAGCRLVPHVVPGGGQGGYELRPCSVGSDRNRLRRMSGGPDDAGAIFGPRHPHPLNMLRKASGSRTS
jgi:hypothetical protein